MQQRPGYTLSNWNEVMNQQMQQTQMSSYNTTRQQCSCNIGDTSVTRQDAVVHDHQDKPMNQLCIYESMIQSEPVPGQTVYNINYKSNASSGKLQAKQSQTNQNQHHVVQLNFKFDQSQQDKSLE